MRLRRDRKNKTKVDVNYVNQAGAPRVRLTLGEDDYRGKKNTDLSVREAEDLIVLLEYWKQVANGDLPNPNE